jgi:hypothetical protein
VGPVDVSRRRLVIALSAVAAALLLALAALDVLGWQKALERGDRSFAAGRGARWAATTRLPADPAGRALGVGSDLALRRAVASFVVADETGRGYDNGLTRSRVRATAETRLTEVAIGRRSADASQADVLLGVLATSGGATAGGETADERARDLFATAVRLDPQNEAAKRNLELVLRRMQAIATRTGAGNGSGLSGHGRRGAGAGSPGRGY